MLQFSKRILISQKGSNFRWMLWSMERWWRTQASKQNKSCSLRWCNKWGNNLRWSNPLPRSTWCPTKLKSTPWMIKIVIFNDENQNMKLWPKSRSMPITQCMDLLWVGQMSNLRTNLSLPLLCNKIQQSLKAIRTLTSTEAKISSMNTNLFQLKSRKKMYS